MAKHFGPLTTRKSSPVRLPSLPVSSSSSLWLFQSSKPLGWSVAKHFGPLTTRKSSPVRLPSLPVSSSSSLWLFQSSKPLGWSVAKHFGPLTTRKSSPVRLPSLPSSCPSGSSNRRNHSASKHFVVPLALVQSSKPLGWSVAKHFGPLTTRKSSPVRLPSLPVALPVPPVVTLALPIVETTRLERGKALWTTDYEEE